MLLLGDGLVPHLEAQRVLQRLHQLQVAALWGGGTGGQVSVTSSEGDPKAVRSPYEYVRAVDEALQPLLGDQQHLIEQEERSLLLHPEDLEGTLQDQLPKAAQVRPAPVHQQGLDFLQRGARFRGQR